jgi:hypothetical protein
MIRLLRFGCVVTFFFANIVGTFSRPLYGTEYTFSTIVDNQGFFSNVFVHSAQPLNDNGEVAFYGESVADYQGMYKSDGSTLTTIATYSQLFLNTGFSGGINDGGSVVFRGDGGAYQRALYAGSGGPLTTYLYENTIDPNPAWIITGAATINDSDQVAFSGGWISNPIAPNPITRQGYYRVNGAGGSVTVMAETGHGVYSGASFSAPALNDAGQAAFMMTLIEDGQYQILRYDNPGVTVISSGFSGSQIVSMNAAGDVAFVNQNSTAANVYHNGSVQTVASDADGFNLIFQGQHFINDAGDVVFAGNVVEHEGNPVNWNGVFSGPDPLNDQVLLYGDSLYGKTVTELTLVDINNNGQILMMVGLSEPENWRGLVLATPLGIPGDFDEDDDVDGRDFLIWQRNQSVGDLEDWQTNYGVGELAANSVAVPEPSGFLLLNFGLVFIYHGIRRATRMQLSCSKQFGDSLCKTLDPLNPPH